jgi:hypothetical protein
LVIDARIARPTVGASAAKIEDPADAGPNASQAFAPCERAPQQDDAFGRQLQRTEAMQSPHAD